MEGGGGEWAAGGRIYLPRGLFGVAISPEVASRRPDKPESLRDLIKNKCRGEYQTHTFHLVPSMTPLSQL